MYKAFHFLSSPYSSDSERVRFLRVVLASQAVIHAAKSFTHLFSPVVHGHHVEELSGHQMPYNYWIDHCFCVLRRAATVKVLCIPGWTHSTGVAKEIDEAKRNSIPVEYLNFSEYCDMAKAASILNIPEDLAVKELLKNAVRHPD